MRFPIEKINEANLNSSEEVVSYLGSTECSEGIQKVGKLLSLHIDQMAALKDEIQYVMVGLTRRTDLVKNLQTYCKVSRDGAEKIVAGLNTDVFMPIREYMQKESDLEKQKEEDGVDETHKESILSQIEYPAPAPIQIHTDVEIPPEILPKKEVSYPTNWMFPESQKGDVVREMSSNTKTTILEEQTKPTNPIEHILKKPIQSSAPQNPTPQKHYTKDPYRELPE